MQDLRVVLETLKAYQLLAKLSKCRFGYSVIDYLDHLISTQGIQADPSKIEVMLKWSIPKNTKAL